MEVVIKHMFYLFRWILLAFMFMVIFSFSYSQWSTDPNINTPICVAINSQENPMLVSDGAGGAIIVWQDNRNGNYDILVQRIDSSGYSLWSTNGSFITIDDKNQLYPKIVSDGVGGAIITWCDYRNGNADIYAQRVRANGSWDWTTGGVPICVAAGNQSNPKIISDGAGGAIISWEDARGCDGIFPDTTDLYIQRINPSGVVQWLADGVIVCSSEGDQKFPDFISNNNLASDGEKGAIVSWEDYRGNDGIFPDTLKVFIQRVDSTGTTLWMTNGVQVTAGTNNQYNPAIVSDSNGGAIIAWEFVQTNYNNDIYTQKVNANGLLNWQAGGVPICTVTGYQRVPNITSDDSEGAIITWYDGRDGRFDVYAQRINSAGSPAWTVDGVQISTLQNDQYNPIIVKDGNGGAIITWRDNRNGPYWDIYSQRINILGEVQWTAGGVPVSTAIKDQDFPAVINCGGSNTIIVWQDNRNTSLDIFVQRLDSTGNLGGPTKVNDGYRITTFALSQNYPNPFNPTTTIEFSLSEQSVVTLKIYNLLGQEVASLIDNELYTEGINDIEFDANKLSSGVYFYHLTAQTIGDVEEGVLNDTYVSMKKMLLLK